MSYRCILADPGWQYDQQLKMTDGVKRSSTSQYTTMSVQQICDLYAPSKVEGGPRWKAISGSIAGYPIADTALLGLWITAPFLIEGIHMRVCNAWGFTPRQIVPWIKASALLEYEGIEHWRQHPRFQLYEISTWGRVRRINDFKSNGQSKILALTPRDDGYIQVSLRETAGALAPVTCKVQWLVAETFIGPRTTEYEIDHVDGDRANNALYNLEYVTHAENMQRAATRGAWPADQGGKSRSAIFRRERKLRLQMGMGFLTRNVCEYLILATRGKYTSLVQTRSENGLLIAEEEAFIVAPKSKHSRKPKEAYAMLERLFPGPRLELFAREYREGWDAWGNGLPNGPDFPAYEPAPDDVEVIEWP